MEIEDAGDWSVVDPTVQEAYSNFGAGTNHSFRAGTLSQPYGLNPISPKPSFGGGGGLGTRTQSRRDSSGGSDNPPVFFLDGQNQPLTAEPQNLEAIHESNTPPVLSREGSQRKGEAFQDKLAAEDNGDKLGSEKQINSSVSDIGTSKNGGDGGIHQLMSGVGEQVSVLVDVRELGGWGWRGKSGSQLLVR